MIIDTTLLIDIIRAKDKKVAEKMEELDKEEFPHFITSITVMELISGALRSDKPNSNEEMVEKLVSAFEILPFDHDASLVAGSIDAYLIKEGKNIGTTDTMIDAIALANNQEILTRNVKHFERVKGLEVKTY